MKTRAQKEAELKKGKELLERSDVLLFADFSKVAAERLRRLRQAVREVGGEVLVIKKRLLNLLLKEKKAAFDMRQFSGPTATVFSSSGIEKASGSVYKFFSALEVPEGSPKDLWIKKILGGYDLKQNAAVDAKEVIAIGQLPPREALLAQLLGALASPIRSLLYVLDQKAKKA